MQQRKAISYFCLQYFKSIVSQLVYLQTNYYMDSSNFQTMRCPFDSNHVMPYERFLNHLDKCKNPNKQSFVKCRYNAYHVIHKDIISTHQEKCPERLKHQSAQQGQQDWWGVDPQPKPLQTSKASSKVGSKVTSYSQETNAQKQQGDYIVQDFDNYNFKKQ